MQWNNNVYRYRSQSLLYVAFLGFVFLIKSRGRCFFQLHKHARIFFFFKWDLLSCYSTRALQFFSLQNNKSILVEASTRNCVRVMKALSWILLQNLRPGLPYTEWVIWLGGRFLCNLVYFKKKLASEDIFRWGFVHHVKIVIVKTLPVVNNFVNPEMVGLQATIYQAYGGLLVTDDISGHLLSYL